MTLHRRYRHFFKLIVGHIRRYAAGLLSDFQKFLRKLHNAAPVLGACDNVRSAGFGFIGKCLRIAARENDNSVGLFTPYPPYGLHELTVAFGGDGT